jgi:phytoene dehydrogenase-like protein
VEGTVVGAAPGGLTAAMILSHKGFDVTVFEEKSQVGGRPPVQIRKTGFICFLWLG